VGTGFFSQWRQGRDEGLTNDSHKEGCIDSVNVRINEHGDREGRLQEAEAARTRGH